MTAQEFNQIKSIDQRANIVWDCSLFVDDRVIYNEYIIKMYSLYDFYVEVWVKTKSLKIEKIKALENETDWKGYLNSVQLQDLY